ncbi:hypothetical protein ACFX2J_018733 [Malus domestica]
MKVLIKAVAHAIPVYPMHVFLFPNTLCDDIDSAIARFWWGQKVGERRIYWTSWETLGKAKVDGGLGFRNLKEFNWAFLAKQC